LLLRTSRIFLVVCTLIGVCFFIPAIGLSETHYPALTASPPKIDGILNEPLWRTAFDVNDFIVISPDTGQPASLSTHIKLAYDKDALYVGAICEQPATTQVRRISARDKTYYSRDTVVVVVDPSGNGRYGYRFEVALGGSMNDATIRPESHTSFNWDAPWRAATSSDDNHWYAECEIPWNVMQWPNQEGRRLIGVFFRRQVPHLSEYWAVPGIPGSSQVFLSVLDKMEIHDINPRGRLTLYPYVFVGYDTVLRERKEAVGTDLFWQPTTNLLVSATVNPDFGQVESDDVVVNFTATETFLQEKRPFFVEGNDIFQTHSLRLVHTRRIGATPRSPTLSSGERIVRRPMVTDIIAAAKATGQIGNTRYGILSAFEDDSDLVTNEGNEVTAEGSDFYAFRALHESNGNGHIAVGYLGSFVDHNGSDAWGHSFDGQWLTDDKRYQLETQVAASDVQGVKGYAWNLRLSYMPKTGTSYRVLLDYADSRFNINDMGYIGRNDRFHFWVGYNRQRYDVPGFKSFHWHINASGDMNHRLLDSRAEIQFMGMLQNRMYVGSELKYYPERWDDRNSRGHGDYRKQQGFSLRISWNTDNSKPIRLYLRPQVYSEENGGISTRMHGSLGFDIRDNWLAGISMSYYNRHDWTLWYGGNRFSGFDAKQLYVNLSSNHRITAKQELRLGIQWVGLDAVGKTAYEIGPDGHLIETGGQVDDRSFDYSQFTGQIRYKFEFAPLSDLFLVYSRGGRISLGASDKSDSLGKLLEEAAGKRDVDRFLVKVRYRF